MTPLRVEGLIDQDIAALLIEQLSAYTPDDGVLRIDLSEADLEDPVVTTQMVEALRTTANRLQGMEVYGAPQVLAHSLYRIGALGKTAKLRLIEPRQEIGSSS